MSECTEERFLKNVAEHQMIIIRDDGLHRHVRFKKPGTYCMHFDLITWPGYLCYTGDMGTFVFRRLDDMFKFFRMGKDDWNHNPNGLSINPGYWSEKLEACDRHGGFEEFDQDEFTRVVNEYRVRWMRDYRGLLSKEQRRELWEAVEEEVLHCLDDGEGAAFNAAHSFSLRIEGHRFDLTDFWDHRFNRYTFRFIWCCYALAWGIQMYDLPRVGEPVAEVQP